MSAKKTPPLHWFDLYFKLRQDHGVNICMMSEIANRFVTLHNTRNELHVLGHCILAMVLLG